MRSPTKPSQLFLTLYICSSLMLFLQTFNNYAEISALSALVSTAASALIITAFFLPSYLLAGRTGTDIITLTQNHNPAAQVGLSAYYTIFLVYISAGILDVYVKMMTRCVNPEADKYVLGLCLLLVSIYGAVKGEGAVTRCGVIIFGFIVLSLILIFSGNISNIELRNIRLSNYNSAEAVSGILPLLPASISAVIFTLLCGNTSGKRGKALAVYIGGLALTFILFWFFIVSALGKYGENSEFPFYTLSKSAQFTVFRGLDCVYLACAAFAAFLLISAVLVCINKCVSRSRSAKNTVMFSVPIYALFVCAQTFDFVSEILRNIYVFITLCFISAVVIPLVYLVIFGRKRNV